MRRAPPQFDSQLPVVGLGTDQFLQVGMELVPALDSLQQVGTLTQQKEVLGQLIERSGQVSDRHFEPAHFLGCFSAAEQV